VELVSSGEVVSGRMADEMFPVRDVLPAQVDAESVSWPASVRDAAFGEYLEALDVIFAARPSSADASVDLDEFQIEKDVEFIRQNLNVKRGLEELVKGGTVIRCILGSMWLVSVVLRVSSSIRNYIDWRSTGLNHI
jgi:hypothetical protein